MISSSRPGPIRRRSRRSSAPRIFCQGPLLRGDRRLPRQVEHHAPPDRAGYDFSFLGHAVGSLHGILSKLLLEGLVETAVNRVDPLVGGLPQPFDRPENKFFLIYRAWILLFHCPPPSFILNFGFSIRFAFPMTRSNINPWLSVLILFFSSIILPTSFHLPLHKSNTRLPSRHRSPRPSWHRSRRSGTSVPGAPSGREKRRQRRAENPAGKSFPQARFRPLRRSPKSLCRY